MNSLLLLYSVLAIHLICPAFTHAQEVSIGQSNATALGLSGQINNLKTSVQLLQNELTKSIACGDNGKIYAPNNAGKDVNGCITSLIPTGTIAAFNIACPTGWSSYGAANGRFLVGTGGGYSLGNTGGQNNVTLRVSQMPSHSHTTNHWFDNGAIRGGTWQVAIREGTQKIAGSQAGGNQPHENRPPYIAVNWCRKN